MSQIPEHLSPLPWKYVNTNGSPVKGMSDWIEDAHGNIVVENVGHIDGPLIVDSVNLRALPASGGEGWVHPDDEAVDNFAAAMKAKLAQKRAEGRGGWEDKDYCSNKFLSDLLRGHVLKGDPVDVANIAMMIHQRGERIAAPAL